MQIIRTRSSPDHDARPAGIRIDTVVLHYTGMPDPEEALRALCGARRVSAHWFVDRGGRVLSLVPEHRRAWHAGVSFWRGRSNVNDFSIGIELDNPGHEWGYLPFPEAQMQALENLLRDIFRRHDIAFVLGHSDIAPQRKQDPGELFDWERLARAGFGLWPKAADLSGEGPADAGEFAGNLARIGYGTPVTQATVIAFQRHFRPRKCDGVIDRESCALARLLLAGDNG